MAPGFGDFRKHLAGRAQAVRPAVNISVSQKVGDGPQGLFGIVRFSVSHHERQADLAIAADGAG
jgi:hypothetical protein